MPCSSCGFLHSQLSSYNQLGGGLDLEEQRFFACFPLSLPSAKGEKKNYIREGISS